jgi:ABC-type branched-subunit amino acid transport system substrate-binding protein
VIGSSKSSIRLLASAAAVLALCTSSAFWLAPAQAAPSAAGTIKIGAYAPLSGPYASAGIDMVRAVKLAAANMNKQGGLLGKKLTVDAQDSPCNPQVAVQAAQKLVTDGVVGVVGPYCSSDALPTSTIFHRAGIPMMDPAATNPQITNQGFNNIFRTIGRDDQQGAFAAKVMVKKLHATRVAIIHDNTVYAKGLATYTKQALAKYPGVKVVYFDAIVPNSKDFSATLTQIKGLNPSVTYFTGYYSDGGLMIKQFYQLGVPGRFMAGDSNNDPTFIKLAGADASKVLVTTAPTPDLIPQAKSFVRQYKATYHTQPGAYSTYSYDGAGALLWAIKTTKSTSSSALISALHKLKNYPGITGPLTFTARGDRAQLSYVVVTVRNGTFVRAKL